MARLINITFSDYLTMIKILFSFAWEMTKFLLPYALIILVTEVLTIIIKNWIDRKWLEKHKRLMDWEKLNGGDFEKVVAGIYKNMGYSAKITGGTGDKGIDIIIRKNGKREFIQCKQKSVVPPKEVREFYGSIIDNLKEGERGFLITTGEFTQEGRNFVKGKPIQLITGLELEKLVKS